jgi:hypothetical protein
VAWFADPLEPVDSIQSIGYFVLFDPLVFVDPPDLTDPLDFADPPDLTDPLVLLDPLLCMRFGLS